MQNRDVLILRELASQVKEISQLEVQDERRDLWRKHNSLIRVRPLIFVRWFSLVPKVLPNTVLQCSDPLFRYVELQLRRQVFHFSIGDDYVIEPWIAVPAVMSLRGIAYRWGPKIEVSERTVEDGSFQLRPVIKEAEDIKKLIRPSHEIDEDATRERKEKIQDAIGDLLEVVINRGPIFHDFTADISTDLAYLRGLEQIMWDMYDNPEFLHELLAFMRDGILYVQQQAEDAGDYQLCNHENQAVSYSMELPDPKDGSKSVKRKDLWAHVSSQEFQTISPQMFDEFLLQYQLPIMEKFGLIAYGCCEDLTRKIKYLRKIPNLRRIAVTPWADLRSCAEQIGQDYVLSWRPSPADHISRGLDPEFVKKSVKDALDIFKEYDCHFDITLKDIQTVNGKPENLSKWVEIVRNTIEENI